MYVRANGIVWAHTRMLLPRRFCRTRRCGFPCIAETSRSLEQIIRLNKGFPA